MEEKISYNPVSFLSKYVDRFYVFKHDIDDHGNLPKILPGTGLELIFYLDKPLSVNGKVLPKIHTICPRKMMHFDAQPSITFLSVRFKSGAFRHFTNVPFSELNDNYMSVTTLWGNKGEELIYTLNAISEISDKIKHIEECLIEVFHTYHDPKDDKWDGVIDELYYNFDSNSITELAKQVNLSLRQFERNFKTQFGITAKEFQKISRFQTVLKTILFSKNPDYLGTILDHGYFDQNHFIKEFKAFTGKTPRQYFLDTDFDDRFYHESI